MKRTITQVKFDLARLREEYEKEKNRLEDEIVAIRNGYGYSLKEPKWEDLSPRQPWM